MHGLTLLERLAAREKPGATGQRNLESLEKSIIRHLTSLLNTRLGTVPIAPDYGIADFADLGRNSENSVAEFRMKLERVIERFEPRLSDVRVTPLQQSGSKKEALLAAVFEIRATVRQGIQKHGGVPLRFETKLDASGAVRLIAGT
jgi:type VI secretion system protein